MTIRPDSQSTAGLLQGKAKATTNLTLIQNLQRKYYEVSTRYTIAIQWTKSHAGQYGNEMADKLAELAQGGPESGEAVLRAVHAGGRFADYKAAFAELDSTLKRPWRIAQ